MLTVYLIGINGKVVLVPIKNHVTRRTIESAVLDLGSRFQPWSVLQREEEPTEN
jgi:hypothetical protein